MTNTSAKIALPELVKDTWWASIIVALFVGFIAGMLFGNVQGAQSRPLIPAFPDGYTAARTCLLGQTARIFQASTSDRSDLGENGVDGAVISDRAGGTPAGGEQIGQFHGTEGGSSIYVTVVGWVDTGSADARLSRNAPDRQGRYWFWVYSQDDDRHGWVVDAGLDDPATGKAFARLAECQLTQR